MPVLSNAKWEKFCQLRLAGKPQDVAYKLAGYKPSEHHASRLAKNPKVVERMKELHIHALNKSEVTVESMAEQFDEDRRLAIKLKQASAAHAASVSKAKLYGLFVERSSINVTHNFASMTEEELRFEIAALHAEARSIKPGVQH